MMNVIELNPSLPEGARATLAALPQFEPSAALWLRIEAQHRARQRRRWAVGIGLAASVLGAVLLLRREAMAPATPDALTALVARVQALELEAARTRSDAAMLAPAALSAEAELARIDAELQQAYDRGAAAVELERLWRARAELLDTLVTAYRRPDHVIRI
jgi:hypothetical protein